MKHKQTLLEQMRAHRQQREAEVTQPFRDELWMQARLMGVLQNRLREIERAIGNEVGRHLAQRVAAQSEGEIMRLIYKEVERVSRASDRRPDSFTFTIDAVTLMGLDPKSLQSQILRRWQIDNLPLLSLDVKFDAVEQVDRFDIRIPELRMVHTVMVQ